jgi:hypothetical protein
MLTYEVLGVLSWENNAPGRDGLREEPLLGEGAPRSEELWGLRSSGE